MSSTFVITLTQEEYNTAAAKLTADNLSLVSGTLPTTDGVSLSYIVDGLMVTFTVLAKPFFIPVGMIESNVKSLLGIS